MVFAERGETISGGNFHGEYPAKVIYQQKDLFVNDGWSRSHPSDDLLFLGTGLFGDRGSRVSIYQREAHRTPLQSIAQ